MVESDELDSEDFKERVARFFGLEYRDIMKRGKVTGKTIDFLWFDMVH